MDKEYLKSEIWETQSWIMYILALLLHINNFIVLFWIVFMWANINWIGIFTYKILAVKKEKELSTPQTNSEN